MVANALVDAGFLVALLGRADTHREWALLQAKALPPPWLTCEAVISEAFHLLGPPGAKALVELLRRKALRSRFVFDEEQTTVLALMAKYTTVPISLADACLVRMTEMVADPVVISTDSDFRVYRRHSRQVVPCVLPE